MFDDRGRLRQHRPVVQLEAWNAALRVDGEERVFAVLPTVVDQMDRESVRIEPLQSKRDAELVRRDQTPIVVKLHRWAEGRTVPRHSPKLMVTKPSR